MKLKSKMNYLKAKPIYILYIKPGKSGVLLKYMKSYDDMFHYFNGWTSDYQVDENIKIKHPKYIKTYDSQEQYNFTYDGYDFYGPVGIFYVKNKISVSIPKDIAKLWKKELCRHNNKKRAGKHLALSTPTGNIHKVVDNNPFDDSEEFEKMLEEYIDEYGW